VDHDNHVSNQAFALGKSNSAARGINVASVSIEISANDFRYR